ncbi:SAM-dependent methyltransferase [Aquisphaera insulae]|uniref:SAM-dependent methyltransferase n=1 Tax=Aquisphaera insulae TaxID=2712864 RepID=UPI0013EE269D|nr:SAM-dependent methyltransferase [Aquisphaera insulae]
MVESADRGRGSLIAVGTGIRIAGQLTTEAIAWMRRADRVLYVVGDPIAEVAIRELNPQGAESLLPMYGEGMPRQQSYRAMVGRMLDCVRSGMVTCTVTYGHPGIFATPTHEAVRQARAEGYPARILPAISAEDCLFADLCVDPAANGCQTYEAADFLLHGRVIDNSASVVLWQIGVGGDPLYRRGGYDLSLLPSLVERLRLFYPPDHIGYVYEAATLPATSSYVCPCPLSELCRTRLTSASTLYIPPWRVSSVDPAVQARIAAMHSAT